MSCMRGIMMLQVHYIVHLSESDVVCVISWVWQGALPDPPPTPARTRSSRWEGGLCTICSYNLSASVHPLCVICNMWG